MSRFLVTCLVPVVLLSFVAAAPAVTDSEVVRAIEKARACLIKQQLPSGLWPEDKAAESAGTYGTSETVLAALAYVGEHPNRAFMSSAIDSALQRRLETTYAISMRAMAYSFLTFKVVGERRDEIRKALTADILWLVAAQGAHGGWNYKSLGSSSGRFDFSNTQMAIQSLHTADRAGVEIPEHIWARAQRLYFRHQQPDGGWNYGDPGSRRLGGSTPSYGSMTAAGLASILTITQHLDRYRVCPCRDEAAAKAWNELGRRVDAALEWLSQEFRADANPKAPAPADAHRFYWLRAAERAGSAAGRLHFGEHDWYREGAEWLVTHQEADGSWGSLPETCFGLLFLYDGRAPVLFTKLRFRGDWNSHPRDMGRLVPYINRVWCHQWFNWHTSDLGRPLAELHEAPILYINVQTPPTFSDEERRRLRAFTDGGGTVLIAPSGQEGPARQWVADLAAKVWPEWPLRPLRPDHPVWSETYRLESLPQSMGTDDGLRTFLFYCTGDLPCAWQSRAYLPKRDLFYWPLNLLRYATDHTPLPPRLAAEPDEPKRYTTPVTSGNRRSLKVARLRYGADGWSLGRHYRGFDHVTAAVRRRANVALTMEDGGVAPSHLGNCDAAYLAASEDTALDKTERAALKQYLANGGFLWVEAVGGKTEADGAVRTLAREAGWQVTSLAKGHPIVTGRFAKAIGYDLSKDVKFRRMLRLERFQQGRWKDRFAELAGIYQDGKFVGLYSPFDVVFSATGYNAYECRGYRRQDALAVATNIILYLTDRAGEQ